MENRRNASFVLAFCYFVAQFWVLMQISLPVLMFCLLICIFPMSLANDLRLKQLAILSLIFFIVGLAMAYLLTWIVVILPLSLVAMTLAASALLVPYLVLMLAEVIHIWTSPVKIL